MKSRSLTRTALVSLMILATVGAASQAFAVRPNNDHRRFAEVVPGLPYGHSSNTEEATASPNDPAHSCVFAADGTTVWYTFTPRRTVLVAANTFGSTYDTVLSVWRQGSSPRALSEVACNDDTTDQWSLQSSLEFRAEANQTYFIRVGSFAGGPGGDLNLDLHRVSMR